MIRFIILVCFVVLFLVCSIPLLIAEWIIGKFNMDAKNKSSLAIVNWAFRCCLFISGTKVTVRGLENVPKDEAVLYIGNHRSYFDILITYIRVPRPTGYIAKKEMLKWPLLVNWMRNLHCLFLDREDVKQGLQIILTAIEKVKSGISICIFPEGTRNKVNHTFMEFHEGSFKIASKTGCPIVPMTIYNSAAIFEDHLPKIRKANVILEYGKPIYPKDLAKEDQKRLGAYTRDVIMNTYAKIKEEAGE
ncbi:MAG: 1-acyl-sn-glycerol-3-phosphate acyltransferase [Lachnospiraceae bacterium]|nr:1-acyl-sn-glycerol-3-phosphate acyltransferase [Lachnospiraceae bacterium]